MLRSRQLLRPVHSVIPFQGNNTTATMYGFRKYLAHDWQDLEAHVDLPLPQIPRPIAKHLDSRQDRWQLSQPNIHQSKSVVAATEARTADPKLLSVSSNKKSIEIEFLLHVTYPTRYSKLVNIFFCTL